MLLIIIISLILLGILFYWRGPLLPWLSPIKSLFPSWRFFDQLGHSFSLEIQNLEHRFEPLFLPLSPSWLHLIWNPQGNLRHAQNSLIQIWLQNPEQALQKKQIERLIEWEKPHLPKPYTIKICSFDQKRSTQECLYQGLLITHE